jgi:hypothetical protein
MSGSTEVSVIPRSPGGLWPTGGTEGYRRFQEMIGRLGARLRGRATWNVSSTSSGDGVAVCFERPSNSLRSVRLFVLPHA